MLEARECQPEVIEPMIERLARDGDAKCRHRGEVGQAHPSRRVVLAEHHIAARAVKSPPSGDAALYGAAHAGGDLRMATADLLEDGHRPDAGGGLKHWHDLALPHAGERVGVSAPVDQRCNSQPTAVSGKRRTSSGVACRRPLQKCSKTLPRNALKHGGREAKQRPGGLKLAAWSNGGNKSSRPGAIASVGASCWGCGARGVQARRRYRGSLDCTCCRQRRPQSARCARRSNDDAAPPRALAS
jgi:hypothetical protein